MVRKRNATLRPLNGAKHAGWQRDECREQVKNTTYRDADDAKRQQQEPDDGVEHQQKKGQWPADDEQDAEEQKFQHGEWSPHWDTARVAVWFRVR